jgi:hypothetical protein
MNRAELEKYIKDPKKLAMPGVFVAIIVIGMLISSSARKEKVRVQDEYTQKEYEMERKKEKIVEVPTQEKIEQLKSRTGALSSLFDNAIFTIKSNQKDYTPLRALPFKEELLKNQQLLEVQAGGFEFPRGFGFTEYLEEKVPTDEELPDLTKEMYLTYEMMKVLKKNNIDKIYDVRRLGKETEFFRRSKDKAKYAKVFSLFIVAEGDMVSLMSALQEMAYAKDVFIVVDRLDLDKVTKEKVKASFILYCVEFL